MIERFFYGVCMDLKKIENDDLLKLIVKEDYNILKEFLDSFYHLKLIDKNILKNLNFNEENRNNLLVSLELYKRLQKEKIEEKVIFHSASDVYEYVRDELEYQTQENLILLLIDIKGSLMRKELVYIGTTSSIPVSIKEIFKLPIKLSSYGFIIVHNHPTGDSRPSDADNKFTKKIMDASKILGIDVIDHIIVGKGEFYSFKNKKVIKSLI